MKQLILIRHAKSSWNQPELHDHDRPLNKRGARSLPLMAEHITDLKLRVDRVISSSAVRAATTAQALAPVLLQQPASIAVTQIEIERGLYQFDWQPLWHQIKQQPDSLRSLALIGHNPALEELQQRLSEEWQRLPTCALALLELNLTQWRELQPGSGSLVHLTYPKALKS